MSSLDRSETLWTRGCPHLAPFCAPAIERGEFVESLFDLIPEFVPYLERLAELDSSRIGSEALRNAPQNVDLWGFFQLPTHLLKPHREFFALSSSRFRRSVLRWTGPSRASIPKLRRLSEFMFGEGISLPSHGRDLRLFSQPNGIASGSRASGKN